MTSRGYRDAFRSTAPYYARYRITYPPAVFDLLRKKFALDGRGRLLDLGCGTGPLAIQLAGDFARVVGMDPEAEMLEEARRIAATRGVHNIDWEEGGSADLPFVRPRLGSFRLVTMGDSFHWMDRDATLQTLHGMIDSEGGVAIMGSGGSDSRWDPPETQAAMDAAVRQWLGERRRAGSGYYEAPSERHEAVVQRSPFARMEVHSFESDHEWDAESLIGSLYSSSYASPYVLGGARDSFAADLRAALLPLSASGRFRQAYVVHAILAWRA